jgi:multidrug efflux pump subunit AcrA (membrane-fusion protein)
VLLTLLLILIFKFSQLEPPVKQEQEKAWVVQTQQLVGGAKSPQLELYGRVESPYAPSLTSSINADIKSLDIREGEYVSQGQRLVSLDDTDVRLVLEERVSNIAELEAMIASENNRYQNDLAALKLEESLVALAEKKLAREEKTSKTNLTSQSSFDSQKQALQNQKLALKARQLNVADHPARLAQLEARLSRSRILKQQAEIDLQRAMVTAPFDGIILKTMVSPGERVRPGEVLLEMYATDQVELRAQLPQKYITIVKQSLADGLALKATVKTGTGPLTVTLSRISGSITNGGIGVDALFVTQSDEAQNLTIGDNLEMILVLPAIENVFSVPVSSLYGTSRIYRVENERLTAVTVKKMGNQFREGKQFILVRSEALKAGDQIITTQLPHALTGLKVEVRNASLTDSDLSRQEASPQQSSRLR